MREPPPSTLWIDVDDLVQYLAHHNRPSGIQRVTFEICQALHRLDEGAGRVCFVRRNGGPRDLITVKWDRLDTAFRLIANPKVKVGLPSAEMSPSSATVPALRAASVPATMGPQQILLAGLTLQGRALLTLAKLPILLSAHAMGKVRHRLQARKAAMEYTRRRAEMSKAQYELLEGIPLKEVAAPGDSLLVLGSPWIHRDYVQTVRWARDERRMRFALLIFDLVPLRRPEWCDQGVISSFTGWHKSVLPLADQVFTISRATANDVAAWAHETGLVLHNPVQPLPMGTGLNHEHQQGEGGISLPPVPHLPVPGSYVLFVSTIEARKNHALLFRVWRRLLSELPHTQVPTLVFAGRVGWLVTDLLQQLENSNWLSGKIRLIRNPTDSELMALYRGCQFTLFPSLFEGWGLPVSESLALGRPCVASNCTSLPEAGGHLARYFDPENLDDACRTIRAVIEDPKGLEAWRARVVREFRHVPWGDSATIIRRTLGALDAREDDL